MKGYVKVLEKKSFILFLSKKYTTTTNTIVCGLLCLLGMMFYNESTSSIENLWGEGGKLWLYSRFNNRLNLI